MFMLKKPSVLIIIIIIFTLLLGGLLLPGKVIASSEPSVSESSGKPSPTPKQEETMVEGKILAVLANELVFDPLSQKKLPSQKLKVMITQGKYQGKEFTVVHNETDNPAFNIKVAEGDRVVLVLTLDDTGIQEVHVADLVRVNHLYLLGSIFVILLLAIGWKMGAKSLCGILITLFLICGVLMPGLLNGYSPVWLTGGIALVATTLTMLVVGGWTVKSLAAILGTLGGVVIAGTLALISGKAAHLTGFGSEESAMLLYLPSNINLDIQGILFSGIIIGALGVCMDVSMSVASAVEEVKRNSPDLSGKELIRSGMNVGRDIMSTQANTLIMAYTGSSIQLILVFMAFKESLVKILNLDMVASEVVRALTGSIGMITVIPITAVIAGTLFGRQQIRKPEQAPVEEETGFWQGWQ